MFWLVVAAAIAVRGIYAFSYLASPLAAQHRADQGYYRDWALAIAGGDVLGREVFEQGPLYAYLLALVYRICGPRDEVAIALQLLAGVATSALVFACARRLFSARAALFAGLACAAFGPLVFYEAMVMKTFLSPLFTIAALYTGLRYAERSARALARGRGLRGGPRRASCARTTCCSPCRSRSSSPPWAERIGSARGSGSRTRQRSARRSRR